MSRRAFVRWILGLLILIGAAATGLYKLLLRAVDAQNVSQPNADSDLSQPKQEQAKTERAAVDENAALFSFMILSDLHISGYDPNTTKHLKEALDDITKFEPPVDALILTGDLTDFGGEDGYRELKKLLSGFKLPPIYANMGNHDYYDIWVDKNGAFNKDTMPNGKTDAMARERFMKFFNQEKIYSSAVVNGYPVIMLSQETYVQEKPEYGEGAWYSDEQMNWFKEELNKHYTGKPMFVMTHQPLPPIGSDGRTHQLIRAKQFREILKPFKNVFVFCGHRHQDFQNGAEHYVKESFHYFHNSSVGRVLNRSFQNAGKDKSQGLYVQVFKDRVTVRGREFSKRSWLPEADWDIKIT
ncbi:metallophosphoesterase family protein [Paenibacillus xerothermodurans]|uniref:Phosphohydrolase n=1 Tax=Paenibacillus xerothermodurans TaxID=1977292 RepID=A0A2W1NQR2_PAEXE|nr:metallophosphoesterase [Paenibacillus xerothermodurans]PZE21203.1 phosphohydrolase [Paenibacillus xerothermodurans]